MKIRQNLENIMNDRAALCLLAVLLVAAIVRIWGVHFGLPFLFHNDEGYEVLRALQLGTGSFDFERISKGGYFYLLFVEYGFLFVALFVTGVVSGANDFGVYFIQHPSAFYLLGRLTSAIIGTLTVYAVYCIGREVYSKIAGLIGAALLAVNVLHAQLSHYIIVDVPMVCLSMFALYFALRIIKDGSPRYYYLAALFAAMATATKISAILVLPALVLAHVFRLHNSGGAWRRFLFDSRLWKAAGLFVLTYVVLAPGILVNFGPLASHFLSVFGGSDAPPVPVGEAVAMAQQINMFSFYAGKTLESMTLPVFALCTFGVLYALARHTQADVILMTYAALVYVVMSLSSDSQLFFPRYVLPMFPVLCLLGGRLLTDVAARLPVTQRGTALLLVSIALMAYPTWLIAQNNRLSLQTDTRALAHAWFDEHVADGATVFIEGSRGNLYEGTVPLKNSPENIRDLVRFYKNENRGKARYFRMALQAVDGKTFDLVGVKADELETLDAYKQLGVEYFVLRSNAYAHSRIRSHWAAFVDAVRADDEIELVSRFSPEAGVTPGPYLEIYRRMAAH